MRTTVRGWAAEKDQFPKRDRRKASPLASPQQPMGHVFLRGQIHQKLFGRSPPVQHSATRFQRHRRAGDPSSFFKSFLLLLIRLRIAWANRYPPKIQPTQKFPDAALVEDDAETILDPVP